VDAVIPFTARGPEEKQRRSSSSRNPFNGPHPEIKVFQIRGRFITYRVEQHKNPRAFSGCPCKGREIN
jgi:hypothetical protein